MKLQWVLLMLLVAVPASYYWGSSAYHARVILDLSQPLMNASNMVERARISMHECTVNSPKYVPGFAKELAELDRYHAGLMATDKEDAGLFPLGSVTLTAPSPSPSRLEVARRARTEGLDCVSALEDNYGVAADSCKQAADVFVYMAYHPGPKAIVSNNATLLIVSSLYRWSESLALYKLGRDGDSRQAFHDGKAWLRAIEVTAGCRACEGAAKQALKKYGEWPPRNHDV